MKKPTTNSELLPAVGLDQIEKEFLNTPKLQAAYAQRSAAAEAAEIVYTLRNRAGLTQKALAEMIGTKQSMIARLENNVPKLGPTFETLAQIVNACGYKVTLRFEEMSATEHAASMAPQIDTEFP